jgi:beta-glucosidase
MRAGLLTAIAGAALVCGCTQARIEGGPVASTAVSSEASEDARIADLLARMSLERKVAQLIQPQINSFTAEDMERYRFGSYLNGGNGGPYGEEFAPASDWLKLADEMYLASSKPLPGGEPVIPTMWGTDAVHGHTNVVGATVFPHNIGLGATRDADLLRRIGAATAAEIAATGIDWNFSPTIAVARDDRWGRTYESYSEDPAIVAPLGAALVEGLQGKAGDPERLRGARVIATAKHFFADGGTSQGVDQGDVNGDIEALKAIHARPYPAAIAAGVESIMASFNSINGVKMHGNRELLTGVLRDEMGFTGLVVGDWNAHGQIDGCKVDDCPQALLAGLDIYMVPDDWKALHANLVRQVRDGTIPHRRGGRPGPAGQAARRDHRPRQPQALGAACRRQMGAARFARTSRNRTRGGRQVAGPAQERRRSAARQGCQSARCGERRRQHRPGRRRLVADLAGRARARQCDLFPRRHFDPCRHRSRRAGSRRVGDLFRRR